MLELHFLRNIPVEQVVFVAEERSADVNFRLTSGSSASADFRPSLLSFNLNQTELIENILLTLKIKRSRWELRLTSKLRFNSADLPHMTFKSTYTPHNTSLSSHPALVTSSA